jgi:hypothetical protein
MGLRRAKAGTGSSVEILERRSAVMEALDLRKILMDVSWVVVGGVATRTYMAESATLDLNILISKRDAQMVRGIMSDVAVHLPDSVEDLRSLLQLGKLERQ